MTIINKDNLKIKTLSEIINDNLPLNLIENTKHSDQYIARFFEKRAKQQIDTLYKALIPADLFNEVESLVNRKYAGKWDKYFNEVQIYFDTFTYEDLLKCNITYTCLYEQSNDTKEKRKLRSYRKDKIWHAQCLLKLVGRGNKNYCSHSLFNEFLENKHKEQEFIKNSAISSTDKAVIALSKATKSADQSRAEKINIINTIEKIAKKRNWNWFFITLTLPGEFHPNPQYKTGTVYNGISPKESAKMLNNGIKRVRALLAKNGIKASEDYIGCFSSETHKDGLIHKHGLFWCEDSKIEEIRKYFEFHFPNINDQSFKINNGQAKASSYVFKYVMKSTNQFDQSINFRDLMGNEKKKLKKEEKALYNELMNNAFRSFNSIRGFSFFGIENCLTKFRYLARNIDRLDIPAIYEVYIRQNDLYSLIESGFFNQVENIYIEKNDNIMFVGCRVNCAVLIKNFFKLANSKVADNITDTLTELALINQKEIYLKLGVILNPNYSRKEPDGSKWTSCIVIEYEKILEDQKILENINNRFVF
ncbi:replication endonuclease [Burkholderia multivorans]|uniref:replication endonuclease n=1 Tax=Burkholderia multivorans TaxID=87883 RepID=UPI001C26730D|nr:replication endonuclease [Burkholderia multivorans]MBU9542850.1 replication endonuclease [Burkholderia multivorans]